MVPKVTNLLCLVLCLGHRILAQEVIKPSIWAVPGTVIPQRSTVTILCKGPPGMTTMLLRSIGHEKYDNKFLQGDQQVVKFFIQNVTSDNARTYYCQFFNNGNWSRQSDLLKLVVTGGYNDILSLTAHHGPRVTSGENVTLCCHSVHHFDSFYLFKNGSNVLLQDHFSQSHNTFIIFPVMLTDGGTYRCYGSFKEQPLYWSRPSKPLDLLVTDPYSLKQRSISIGVLAAVAVILLFLLLLFCCFWHQAKQAPLMVRPRPSEV